MKTSLIGLPFVWSTAVLVLLMVGTAVVVRGWWRKAARPVGRMVIPPMRTGSRGRPSRVHLPGGRAAQKVC